LFNGTSPQKQGVGSAIKQRCTASHNRRYVKCPGRKQRSIVCAPHGLTRPGLSPKSGSSHTKRRVSSVPAFSCQPSRPIKSASELETHIYQKHKTKTQVNQKRCPAVRWKVVLACPLKLAPCSGGQGLRKWQKPPPLTALRAMLL